MQGFFSRDVLGAKGRMWQCFFMLYSSDDYINPSVIPSGFSVGIFKADRLAEGGCEQPVRTQRRDLKSV